MHNRLIRSGSLVAILAFALAGLAAALFASLAQVGVRRLTATEPAERIVFYFSAVGLVCGLIWMLYSGMSPLTWHGVGLLLRPGKPRQQRRGDGRDVLPNG